VVTAPTVPLEELCDRLELVDHDVLRQGVRYVRRLVEGGPPDLEATFARLRETLEAQLADEAMHVLPACRRLDEHGNCDEALLASMPGLEDDHLETLTLLERLEELATGEAAAAVAALSRDVREHIRLEHEVLFPRVLDICGGRASV
jgi:iron-sulfur cluster repair protein YtfE (RIC family)